MHLRSTSSDGIVAWMMLIRLQTISSELSANRRARKIEGSSRSVPATVASWRAEQGPIGWPRHESRRRFEMYGTTIRRVSRDVL